MRTHIILGSLLILISSTCLEVTAADYFRETFDGPALSPGLVDRNNSFALQNSEARSTAGRNYLRTSASDYNLADFEAEVIYAMNGGGGGGGFFFGFGQADKDPAYFNEPLFSVFAIDHTQDFSLFQGTAVRSIPVSGQPKMFFSWADAGTLSDGTNALRLIKRGDQLTFEMDHAYEEAAGFTATYTGTIAMTNFPFLNSGNSHIFFGTDVSPTRVRDFRVTALGPRLSVIPGANNLRLAWSQSFGDAWRLQMNTNLAFPNGWTEVAPPYPATANDYAITQPLPLGNIFYRLYKP